MASHDNITVTLLFLRKGKRREKTNMIFIIKAFFIKEKNTNNQTERMGISSIFFSFIQINYSIVIPKASPMVIRVLVLDIYKTRT